MLTTHNSAHLHLAHVSAAAYSLARLSPQSTKGKKMSEGVATKGKPFKVFMGYDSHEDITFEVAKFSMEQRASVPVDVQPLKRTEFQKRGIYWRTQVRGVLPPACQLVSAAAMIGMRMCTCT